MLSYPYVDEGFKCFFTLKTLKIPKTFSTLNLHIRNFCCTFAPESSTPGFRGWEMSPSRKAKLFDPIPSRGFQDILKRRLLTLCSDESKSRKFPLVSELSNGRCPTGYRLSLLCLLVRLLHIHVCAHAYLDYVARRMFIFGVGFALLF